MLVLVISIFDGVFVIVSGIGKGEGILGKLMKDDEMYYNF